MIELVRPYIEKFRESGLLLDANVFVLWIVGTFNTRLIAEHKRTRDYEETQFHVLDLLISGFDRLLVTPHVLTEVSNLAAMIKEPYALRIREAFGEILRDKRVVEVQVASRELSLREEFPLLGLTDASIVDLAAESPLVATDDNDLIGRLEMLGKATFSVKRMFLG